jgi:rubrerythrin
MRFEQTREVLQHAKKFHEQVSVLCRRLSGKCEQERIRMLLDYMSERESQLAKAIDQFANETSDNVLDTWFQYTQDKTALTCPDFELTAETKTEDVLRLGLELAQCLIEMYKEIADNADSEEIQTVFRNLLEREEKEKLKLARNAQMLDDI